MDFKLVLLAVALVYLTAPAEGSSLPELRKLIQALETRLEQESSEDDSQRVHITRHNGDGDHDGDDGDRHDGDDSDADDDDRHYGDDSDDDDGDRHYGDDSDDDDGDRHYGDDSDADSDERAVSTRGNTVSEAFIYQDELYVYFLSVGGGGTNKQFTVDVYNVDTSTRTAHESNIAFYETHKIKNIPIGSNYVVHACRQGDPASNCDIFVCPAKAQGAQQDHMQECVKKVKYCSGSRASVIPNKPGSWVCNQINQNNLARFLFERFLN